MAVMRIRLNPEKLLSSMQNLGLIADPGRARKQHVSLENIEKGKKQRLRARRNNNLLGAY